ncbi:MAG: InlB B-repeat-containing protein [Clostridia bacterium]|nr:InlB B-repeat-containing protein [Clostridia bacterium]
MTSVPVGTNHDLILYARWSEITYNVTYRVYLSPVGAITDSRYLHYTVSKGLQDLPNPTIYNYEFLGWYKDDGTEVTRIPVGSTGDIILNAYWTSFRNMAKRSSNFDEPTYFVDSNNGIIYFAYELGTIENVPLSDNIWTIQGVAGLSQQVSMTVSTSVSESRAYQIAETVTNSTTNSGTWTLSEDWTDSINVDEGWANQHGMEQEEAETLLTSTTDTYSLTTSTGASGTHTSNTGTTTLSYDSQNYEHGSESQSVNTSTTLTYSVAETTTTTRTYSTDGKSDGWYRLVVAGRLHVFGVVGYDVASKSYFAYTFGIMEDETYDFLDYSPFSSFDDNEHAALPFEVPSHIFDYVNRVTLETEGLLFRTNTNDGTATVVGYIGSETDVLIPSFYSNGGNSYRVTGITANAFAGKDIHSIILSEYINEIPDGAFKNCTNLEEIYGAFTVVGSEAFSGCTSLTNFKLPASATSVGANAFLGVPEITALVVDNGVAAEILNSGANSIKMDLSEAEETTVFTLNVPNLDSFDLSGGKKTFTDLKLTSDANATIIRNIKIKDCTRIPLVISSDNITLDTVTVNSPSFALIAKSPNVNITMVRDNVLNSASGNAVVCKNPTLISEVSTRATIGVLDVSGNVYVCGNPPIPGVDYLDVTNGEIIYITDDQFNSLIRGCFTVTFDPNGGSVSTTSKDVEFGAKYGTLPTPTRATFDFMGWYTDPDGGTLVTADTVSTVIYDQTLYAHWELKQYTVTFDANGGSVSPTTMAAVIGTAPSSLPTPTRTGHTFAGWYTAASGGTQVTVSNWNTVIGGMDATTLVTNGLTLYAHWTVNPFTVTWSNGTGYTITVKRTSSPYAGASTGNLSSGATVYYGDVLTVTYTPATGYSIATHGSTSITVTGNVNSSTIYATASANSYTYNIVYRSVNGTNLGSTTITKTWGTTVTVSAPDKSSQGYTTPGSQTVTWDSTTPKTITFTYGIKPVDYTTKSGTMDTSPKLTYSATLQYQNRTATTVQVRVVWTATIGAGSWTVYGQQLNASTNAGSSSVQVVAFNAWANSSSSNRSSTGTTGWMTVNLNTTNATTASVNVYLYQFNSNGTDMTNGYGTACVNTTWTMSIPAY